MAYTLFAEKNRVAWQGVRPGVYGEQILASGSQTGAGTTTLYTVPAAKTLLLFGSWALSEIANFALLAHNMSIYTGGGVAWYSLLINYNLGVTGLAFLNSERYVPIEIPAAYTIRLVVAVAGTISGGIHGLLVDPLENV